MLIGHLFVPSCLRALNGFLAPGDCEPLPRTCFPGEALSETFHKRNLLADPYNTSSLTKHLCSWLQPQMWEGLKLKVDARLEKNLFMNRRATTKLYTWTKPRYLTAGVSRRWVWVCWCSTLIWNKDRCLMEHLVSGKRKKQQLLKRQLNGFDKVGYWRQLKLCCL